MKAPIIITGCARSGTSMTAGIINIGGAFGGDMFGPNQYNEKGMFENRIVRQDIVKPYFRRIGADPLGQKPLPNNQQIFEVSQKEANRFRDAIEKEMKLEGCEEDQVWFYKGAKSCLVWYLWYLAFPAAQWVIVHREHKGIIRSCLRTRFMKAYQTVEGWQTWIDQHEQRFAEMHTAGLNIIDFWPSTMIEGNYEPAREMIEKLGLRWYEKIVRAFIDPKLYAKL